MVYHHNAQTIIEGLIFGDKRRYDNVTHAAAPIIHRYKYPGLLNYYYSRQTNITQLLSLTNWMVQIIGE